MCQRAYHLIYCFSLLSQSKTRFNSLRISQCLLLACAIWTCCNLTSSDYRNLSKYYTTRIRGCNHRSHAPFQENGSLSIGQKTSFPARGMLSSGSFAVVLSACLPSTNTGLTNQWSNLNICSKLLLQLAASSGVEDSLSIPTNGHV